MEAVLERFCDSEEQGVFGVLKIEYTEFYTVELPWKDNEERVSCIPAGRYVCKRVVSPKFGVTFEITDVDDRTHILFHAGNTVNDLLGCVALGEGLGYVEHRWAVTSSRNAMRKFFNLLIDDDEFDLEIRWKDHA